MRFLPQTGGKKKVSVNVNLMLIFIPNTFCNATVWRQQSTRKPSKLHFLDYRVQGVLLGCLLGFQRNFSDIRKVRYRLIKFQKDTELNHKTFLSAIFKEKKLVLI